MKSPNLCSETQIKVRFNEVDALRIVWHGHYVKYFEDGREDFGKKHGIGYQKIEEAGYLAPVVELNCNYKKPLVYGDTALVQTTFIPSAAAKLIFKYEIFHTQTQELIATGKSVQVFLDKNGELVLLTPSFFEEWKYRLFKTN